MNRQRGSFAGLVIALSLAFLAATARADLSFDEWLHDKSPVNNTIRPGCYYAEHWVRLEEGAQIRIKLQSKDFDSYLILMDDEGKLIAEDDDSGGGSNAEIRFTPDNEKWYRVIATTAKPGKKGAYTVTIRDDSDHELGLNQEGPSVSPVRGGP